MVIREVRVEERADFDQVATHPLQAWAWGEFREKTGLKVIRLGAFEKEKIKAGYQLTVHPIPRLEFTVVYFPKGPKPDEPMLETLAKVGQEEGAIMVKLEPNVAEPVTGDPTAHTQLRQFLAKQGCRPGRPLFTPFTSVIDLTPSEEELLAGFKEKTRYNVRLAERKGVKVVEDNSDKAFETYLKLLKETTQRQGFYAHTEDYHRKMWQTLHHEQKPPIAHLLTATYQGEILVTWILFVFHQVLYYPYGASSREFKEVMAPSLMMWEAIRFGKKMGCSSFDLWGSLGPEPSPSDPWFGWHRFKEGFGPQTIEFVGSYDLVINPQLYPLYRLAEEARWKWLRLKSRLT